MVKINKDEFEIKIRKEGRVKRAVKLLKFLQSVDDVEIIKSSLESITELLEEEID